MFGLGSLTLVLVHPAAPWALWALHQPAVTDTLTGALGVGVEGMARRLDTEDNYTTTTTTTSSGYGYYYDPQQHHFVGVMSTVRCGEDGDLCPDYEPGVFDDRPAVFWIVYLALPFIIYIVTALIFKTGVTDRRPPLPPAADNPHAMTSGEHEFGLCGCCQDVNYCLHGCCCQWGLTADVFSSVGATWFWCAIAAYILTNILTRVGESALVYLEWRPLTDRGWIGLDSTLWSYRALGLVQLQILSELAWLTAAIPLAVVCAKWRRRLREKMGDPNWGGKFATDCVLYWCCTCCAVIQDMRQLDAFSGVKVECCCRLAQLQAPQGGALIGAPVGVGADVETNKVP